jgi:anti-sigma regulatory factor (Ser/Thr protein kinase)
MQTYKQFGIPITLTVAIKNQLFEIDAVNQAFWAFAHQNKVEHAVSQTLILAFDELLSNVINYAYDDDDEHEIEIKIKLTDDAMIATIIDDGIPFNPLQREEPDTTLALDARQIGGLGIHLVRQIIDNVTYSHDDGRNIVTLTQYR